MILTNEQLRSVYFGAYRFEETPDGWLAAHQYTAEQVDYFKGAFDFWYERCTASTAKTIELRTSATEISFDWKVVWLGSPDSFELAVDGLVTDIRYIKDLIESELKPVPDDMPADIAANFPDGVPTFKLPAEGRLTFTLPAGEKNVILYLPADATAYIRNFEINGDFVPAEKNEKVLWLGDSITQGYGPLRSSCIYVSVANRILNYDIINQGIGGYIYDKKVLMEMKGYKPAKIIVALGTNQYGDPTMDAVEEYYARLTELYGDTPVLCVTPIWRGDYDKPEALDTLEHYRAGIAEVCAKYPQIKVVDGFKLVPHLPEYYLDNLHPNCHGAEIYGRNLVAEIERLGF